VRSTTWFGSAVGFTPPGGHTNRRSRTSPWFLTSSPGTAGRVRAQLQLLQLFSATLSRVAIVPQVAIPAITSKIVDGRLVDEAALAIAVGAVEALLHEIGRGS